MSLHRRLRTPARFAYVGGTPSATATSSGAATFTFGATAPGATREATITLVALGEGVTPKRPGRESPPTPAATPLSPPTTSP